MTIEQHIENLKKLKSFHNGSFGASVKAAIKALEQQSIGHCKDCRYFEYDSVANVDGIPLIVAHEICSRWGSGCKTREDGYCFLFEQQVESED